MRDNGHFGRRRSVWRATIGFALLLTCGAVGEAAAQDVTLFGQTADFEEPAASAPADPDSAGAGAETVDPSATPVAEARDVADHVKDALAKGIVQDRAGFFDRAAAQRFLDYADYEVGGDEDRRTRFLIEAILAKTGNDLGAAYEILFALRNGHPTADGTQAFVTHAPLRNAEHYLEMAHHVSSRGLATGNHTAPAWALIVPLYTGLKKIAHESADTRTVMNYWSEKLAGGYFYEPGASSAPSGSEILWAYRGIGHALLHRPPAGIGYGP